MSTSPRVLIHLLIKSGLNEREITDLLRADGAEVSTATVNRIKNGLIKRTGFDVGIALMRLHERRSLSRDHAA